MDEVSIADINHSISEENNNMEGRYLTFWVEDQLFGIPILPVVQIVGIQKIIPIPEFPYYARGVMNLRGMIIPLIDVRLRLGKPEKDYGDRTCVIVIHLDNSQHHFGLIVDQVDEVTSIDEDQISKPPRLGNHSDCEYLTGIARKKIQDKIILCMDAEKLLGSEFEAGLEAEPILH